MVAQVSQLHSRFLDLFGPELVRWEASTEPTTPQEADVELAEQVTTVGTLDALLDKQAVAIIFAAHWDHPSRQVLHELIGLYQAALARQGLEVVYVSFEPNEPRFEQSLCTMPWVATPHSIVTRSKLSQQFSIRGIPTIVILDGEAKVTNQSGWPAIQQDPTGIHMPWHDHIDSFEYDHGHVMA